MLLKEPAAAGGVFSSPSRVETSFSRLMLGAIERLMFVALQFHTAIIMIVTCLGSLLDCAQDPVKQRFMEPGNDQYSMEGRC